MKCIYCPNDARGSKQEYHVAPKAAGNFHKYLFPLEEVVLPKGLACDGCNAFFSRDIDPAIANHPYVLQWRAYYGVKYKKKGGPTYKDSKLAVTTSKTGLVVVRGEKLALDRNAYLTLMKPSVEKVDHVLISRGVHKIAFEYELRETAKRSGLDAARKAAQKFPLSSVADFIRRGDNGTYRPYGVEFHGARRVSIMPMKFTPDPKGICVGPPEFTGFIVGLPGARFSCTLADDSSLLHYMLTQIGDTEAAGFLSTREVYWTPNSASALAPREDNDV